MFHGVRRLSGTAHEIGPAIAMQLRPRIYSLKAERFNVGSCAHGASPVLKTDAANLPEVLGCLQSNAPRFRHFNRLVHRVFPHITRASVVPMSENRIRIDVWGGPEDSERADLAVPLAACGTGVGQVLAMLYVLVTSEHPRVFLIDEPNSFLHPGAVRELFAILRDDARHQYIISTHSPGVIAAAAPSSIHVLRADTNGATRSRRVNGGEIKEMRELLTEVGATLSEVFGTDAVLWVEGKTEELAVPLILEHFRVPRPANVAILGVTDTGSFDRSPTLAVNVYTRLASGRALMPPAIGFLFDRETRPDTKLDDLSRQTGNRVRFLRRRTFENYLLDENVLFEYLRSRRECEVTREDVARFLDTQGRPTDAREKWLREVDAPRLLKSLFDHFSANTLQYRKVEHSRELTALALQIDPRPLEEIARLAGELLDLRPPAVADAG